MTQTTIRLNVNGQAYEVAAPPDRFLVDLLRDDMGIMDTQEACDEGECGSCTVLIDDEAVDSCIYLAAQCDDRRITTASGLSSGGTLSPLQRAFARTGAVQCGFCTPGFVVAAEALLRDNPHPNDDDIRSGLAGNLCRCTGYTNIVAAVRQVAEGTHDE